MILRNALFSVLLYSTFLSSALANDAASDVSNDVASSVACAKHVELEDGQPTSDLLADLLEKAVDGAAESQFQLGQVYEYGRGVRRNDSAARCWYEMASAQQHSTAQYRLAVMLDNGWGVVEDKKKAFRNYNSAAHHGHVLAQHDLAMMYFYGSGTARNLVQAYRWLRIANLDGSDLMYKHLRMVAAEMTPGEITLAEFLAKQGIDQSGI